MWAADDHHLFCDPKPNVWYHQVHIYQLMISVGGKTWQNTNYKCTSTTIIWLNAVNKSSGKTH